MAISNGTQFVFSLLYLLLIYNVTLISQEYDWGKLEKKQGKLRCTIVQGRDFQQSYLLQLPKRVLFPLMVTATLMHWLLGESISTQETMWRSPATGNWPAIEISRYAVRTLTAMKMVLLSLLTCRRSHMLHTRSGWGLLSCLG